MKKTAFIVGVLMLSGCGLNGTCNSCVYCGGDEDMTEKRSADDGKNCNACFSCEKNKAEENAPEPAETIETAPVADSCTCSCGEENACVQENLLKPRVTEKSSEYKVRRNCPDDVLTAEKQSHVIVPNVPEVYMILGGRVTETMLEGAKAVYEQENAVRFYVEDTSAKSDDLPGGREKGVETIKKRLRSVGNILVAESPAEAEYIVKTEADWLDTPMKKVPAIKCRMTVTSRDGVKIGEWTEAVHRPEGDKSWW